MKYFFKTFITVLIIIGVITGLTAYGDEYFEPKKFIISEKIKEKGTFFEPSAVAWTGNNLIILSDKPENGTNYIYIADLNGNVTEKTAIKTDREEKDFEAITHCSEDGTFYGLFSHSFGDKAKRGLVKINYSGNTYNITGMPETLSGNAQRDILYDSFNRVLNADEINIEGLAYYKGKYNEFLFFGLRTPLLDNKTSVWRLNFRDLKEGKIQTPTLWFTFNGDTGNGEKESISSIEYYPELSALFILTTYESKNGIGGALWVAKTENPEDCTIELPSYPVYQWKDIKPEGLTLIKNKDGKDLIYIIFDNDEKETSIPGMYTILPMDRVCPFFK